jgi:LytS/YehU family sensor histidine kinase
MVLSLILSIFGYHFFKRWNEDRIVAAELEKEKALVQYDNLKNQLNPHFLFNSLTSLNSLIYVNPQLASDFLQQLSKVFRYVLDNKEKNLVSIETEISFVKHYVQLLKARFETGLDVLFEVDDDALQKAIVPVTLQILIENAIKHNATQKDSPLVIKIYTLPDYLVVENNLQKKNVADLSNRQGLENLKNLYHYLTDKAVQVEESKRFFAVKIPLLEL